MGPGCPVCVTDARGRRGRGARERRRASPPTATCCACPARPLAGRRARRGRPVEVVYSVAQAVELARGPRRELVFFATGFETTAVATAAVLLGRPAAQLLGALGAQVHPAGHGDRRGDAGTRIEGFLAAGHAATITGWGVFEPFVARHHSDARWWWPASSRSTSWPRSWRSRSWCATARPRVVNAFPRCVTREGNRARSSSSGRVFEPAGGEWRGHRARAQRQPAAARGVGGTSTRGAASPIDRAARAPRPARPAPTSAAAATSWRASPRPTTARCSAECVPDSPGGACMVSSEGTCRIWHQYGGRPDDLAAAAMSRAAGGRMRSEKPRRSHRAEARRRRPRHARADRAGLRPRLPPRTPAAVGLDALDDGAALRVGDRWLVVTTDSHVVTRCSSPAATSAGSPCAAP
jgi:hydrogenase expression/formation protein HypD